MGVHEGGCIGGRTGRGIGVGVTYGLSLSPSQQVNFTVIDDGPPKLLRSLFDLIRL